MRSSIGPVIVKEKTMISLKNNVRLADLVPQMVVALVIIAAIYARRNIDCVVTSGNDSKHSPASWHYKGRALDFRCKQGALDGQEVALRDEIKAALGDEFDVVLEAVGTDNEHIHVEYDPK
jgi:hypothetical protein